MSGPAGPAGPAGDQPDRRHGPPAGWYPDPAGGTGSRWWDGVGWSDRTSSTPPPHGPSGPPAGPGPSGPPAGPGPTGPPRGAPLGGPASGPARPTSGAPTLPPPGPPPGTPGPPRPFTPYPVPPAQWAGPAPYPVATWAGPGPATGLVPVALGAEGRMVPWARRAVVAYAVLAVAQGAVALAYARTLRRELTYIGAAWDAGQHHQTLPVAPQVSAGFSTYTDLVAAGTVAALILLLVWQYRAAVAARSLGLPARRSPGWGVGSWFVPVVNLWLPYGAIRDCLPPGHPGRRRVLRYWLAFLGAAAAGGAVTFTAPFSRPAAVVVLVVAAGLWGLAAVWAVGVYGTIYEAHRGAGPAPAPPGPPGRPG